MAVRGTSDMIAGMAPRRRSGTFVFATSDDPSLAREALATVREDEGMSLLLPVDVALDAGLDVTMPMAWLTLTVNSALDGVGLTAAAATALAEAGIACNVVAGHRHDHILVPEADAGRALQTLRLRAAAEAPDA
ncbi:ACT domain-containing protein [Jannaschia rubra]|uniref:Uncharacterized protein n=1 Tax=Jannaschia rubra TaxID=282197 RepID=A0A0M6XPB5_9RHOB|nr:ACT domain-containing protein [Jannaschia rubra]CTQ32013.1 hypothetical protein JAN5088_00772 [Jannaschia rubra]SFG39852.1 hypothetical protein SAMN04488517_104222 [Jannaschia rubra]